MTTHGQYVVEFTHVDKVLFPADGITKGDIIIYYRRIAHILIPLICDRPLALQRFVSTIDDEGFYQKERGGYFPAWIRSHTIRKKTDGAVHAIICNNTQSLLYLVNQLALVFHIWPARIDKLHYPDKMIFDLDPSGNAQFADVRWAALQCKKLLDQFGLISYVMLTGSRGVHVVVPLDRTHLFKTVYTCAHAIAQRLVAMYPDRLTLEIRKEKRGDKIFLDVLRNNYGHHSVAPYSVRALPGAPIAAPISWDELVKKKIHAHQFTITNIFRRLSRIEDPWKYIDTDKQSITHVIKDFK